MSTEAAMGALFVLLGLPITIVFACFALCCAGYAFLVGIDATSQAKRYQDARSSLCIFLAVTLCEALINGFVLPAIVFGFSYYQSMDATPLRSTLVLTTPMLVLGLPILGLGWNNPTYRQHSMRMLGFSFLRWAIVIGAWYSLFRFSYATLFGLVLPNLMFIIGGLLLWKYTQWAQRLLQSYRPTASIRTARRIPYTCPHLESTKARRPNAAGD
jgi:hypothetical protein